MRPPQPQDAAFVKAAGFRAAAARDSLSNPRVRECLGWRAMSCLRSDVLEALRVALPDTRNKDGCESLDVTVNQDDPDNMLLVMRWTSRRHYQTYRDWREANGDVKRFADATVNGLSTRFFDVADA
jgi:quinol monooxygenase YgiN